MNDVTRGGEITFTDLFAGAGGLSEGLVQASPRFRAAQAVEWDRDAAATYRQNFPHAGVFHGDINDWVRQGDIENVDVVVGGPPCQGFSTLGKQDENDEKNFLWHQYAKVVVRAEPRYFVMENVPQFERSQQRDVFLEELESGNLRGYRARIHLVNTADYGTPQIRKRMIILGWRRDQPELRMPPPTVAPDRYLTVRDAFTGLPRRVVDVDLPDRRIDVEGVARPGPFRTDELHLTREYRQLSLQRFSCIPPGGNRMDLPDELLTPCWRRHTSGSGDVMGRLHWDRPSVTIRTEFNKPEKGRYLHPEEHRAITHHEAARLMGFPDDYLWVGSKTEIAKQIGNAVPIQLGAVIGRRILALVTGGPIEDEPAQGLWRQEEIDFHVSSISSAISSGSSCSQ